MKTVEIKLYSLDELSEKAKTKAISEHRDFLCFIGEWDDSDDDNADEIISENIRANDYLFYADGDLSSCTHYWGKHEKAGTTELTIGTDVYIVPETNSENVWETKTSIIQKMFPDMFVVIPLAEVDIFDYRGMPVFTDMYESGLFIKK